ncbi:MAG: hypothetical protein Q7J80_11895 [Anaerolineales bacterium]|nr:hypothetical protein [Anaerolineales bacterium]
MKLSFLTKEDRYGKAIRTFYTQDQESKKPLIALAAYSGTTVSQVTRQLSAQTRDILGRDFFMVADKEGTVVNSSRNCINSTALRC